MHTHIRILKHIRSTYLVPTVTIEEDILALRDPRQTNKGFGLMLARAQAVLQHELQPNAT